MSKYVYSGKLGEKMVASKYIYRGNWRGDRWQIPLFGLRIWLWRPEYFYVRRAKIVAASDGWLGFNQGLGVAVLSVRWRE